jgi:hypothetical protein
MVNSFVFFHYIFLSRFRVFGIATSIRQTVLFVLFISVISGLLCAMARSVRMSRFQYNLISSFSIMVYGLYLYHGSVISVS